MSDRGARLARTEGAVGEARETQTTPASARPRPLKPRPPLLHQNSPSQAPWNRHGRFRFHTRPQQPTQGRPRFQPAPPLKPKPPLLHTPHAPAETQTTPASHPHAHVKPRPPPLQGTRRLKGNFGRHGRFRFHIHAPAETQATPASPKLPISGAMEQAREARVSRTPTTTHTGAAQVSTRAPTETQTTPTARYAPPEGQFRKARALPVSHTPTTTQARAPPVSRPRPPLKPKPDPLQGTRRLKGNFGRQGRFRFHLRG